MGLSMAHLIFHLMAQFQVPIQGGFSSPNS